MSLTAEQLRLLAVFAVLSAEEPASYISAAAVTRLQTIAAVPKLWQPTSAPWPSWQAHCAVAGDYCSALAEAGLLVSRDRLWFDLTPAGRERLLAEPDAERYLAAARATVAFLPRDLRRERIYIYTLELMFQLYCYRQLPVLEARLLADGLPGPLNVIGFGPDYVPQALAAAANLARHLGLAWYRP